jgi:hypothetical protein
MRVKTDPTAPNKQDRRFSFSDRIDFTMDLPFLLAGHERVRGCLPDRTS